VLRGAARRTWRLKLVEQGLNLDALLGLAELAAVCLPVEARRHLRQLA
jgi:hypothetical protein